jgi:hypothetical protein
MEKMRRIAGAFVVGALVGGALVAPARAAPAAEAPSKEALALAGRMFQSAGLEMQLKPLPAQFEEGVLENRGKVPDDVLSALATAGKQAYALPALRSDAIAAIARKLSVPDMKETLAWLDGPVGKRVTRAEEQAASGMTPQAMQQYLEREKTKPSSPKRTQLISELITSTNSVEIGATFMEALALGVALGVDATQPEEKQIGIAGLRERMREAMPPDKLRAELAASLPMMYGFTYRGVSEADLAAYVKFNKSPLGKRYNGALMDALSETLTRASLRIGEMIKTAPEKKNI